MSRKIPAAKFDEYVRAFDAETGATGEVHTADKDLVKHFLNFSSVRYSVERKDAAMNTRPVATTTQTTVNRPLIRAGS